MTPLVLAVLVFIAAHSLPASPPVRAALIRRIGKPAYMLAYSALSLLLIVWIGVAYRQAPYIGLWGPDPRLHWVPLLGMPVVCLLVCAGLATPNPLSLTLRRSASGQTGQTGLTAQVPPLLRLSRHPVLLGLALWAGLHGVANGDVASLILFGLMGGAGAGGNGDDGSAPPPPSGGCGVVTAGCRGPAPESSGPAVSPAAAPSAAAGPAGRGAAVWPAASCPSAGDRCFPTAVVSFS